MCYGFDGDRALERAAIHQGASRRNLLRGAVAGAATAAAVGLPQLAGAAAAAPTDRTSERYDGRRRVPHNRISIQMYTLRDATEPPDGSDPIRIGPDAVIERLGQYGYPRIERAGTYDYTARRFLRLLDRVGIWSSSSHEGISEDRRSLHRKLQYAAALRQRYVVVPFLFSESLSEWQRWADQMNEEAEVARQYGLRYGYHNHAHEFTIDLGRGRTPWDVLTHRLDPRLVHLEVDLYWVYTGGVETGAADPNRFAIDVIRHAPQRVLQYHVKDRDAETGDMCDLGTGVVDFPRIFRAHQVKEYIVENDTPDVTPLTTAAVGHLYLEHLRF